MVYPINHIFPDWHSHLVGMSFFPLTIWYTPLIIFSPIDIPIWWECPIFRHTQMTEHDPSIKNHPHLGTYLGNQIRELVHVVLSCFIGWTLGPPIFFEMLVPLLHFCWDCPAVRTKGRPQNSQTLTIFVSSGSKPFDLWSPIKIGFSHVLPPFSHMSPIHLGSLRFPTCSHLRLEA